MGLKGIQDIYNYGGAINLHQYQNTFVSDDAFLKARELFQKKEQDYSYVIDNNKSSQGFKHISKECNSRDDNSTVTEIEEFQNNKKRRKVMPPSTESKRNIS